MWWAILLRFFLPSPIMIIRVYEFWKWAIFSRTDIVLDGCRWLTRRLREGDVFKLSFLSTSSIESLDLNDNNLGDWGLQHLLTILLPNHRLKHLHIQNNTIHDLGAELLAGFLGRHSARNEGEGLFLDVHHSLELVDIRDNAFSYKSTTKLLKTYPQVLFSPFR